MNAPARCFATASELARRIRSKEISSREVVDAHLSTIADSNPRINAIVTLDSDCALDRARAADEALARGETWGPLHGVPFTLKDALATKGVRTTIGDPSFSDYVPASDATAAARLKSAGAILLGKTNVPPRLMSAQTQNPIFGRTNNPWNLGRTVGGSSGGSAAAVAAGLSPLDVGSDLTGSIRMPAHYCGVFGLKPTAHRLPITGHIWPAPGAMRFDRLMCTIGPLARSIEDLKLVASILAGPDGLDVDVAPVAWRPHPRLEPASLRVAFLPASPGVPTSRSVRITVERVALELERAGAGVEERTPGFTIDEMNQVWVDYFALFSSTTLSLFATSLPVQPKQHSAGTLFEWARVLGRRDDLVIAIDSLLSEFDAFLCPAGIGTAFPHSAPGSKIPVDGVEVESRFVDYYTYPFSFTGSPAVVVPAAIADDGLPIGVQLVGKRWADERLLAVADVLVELTGGFRQPPEMESAS